MAGLYPISGSKLYVGSRRVTAKGKVSEADFTDVEWIEIDGWTNAGALGDTQEVGQQAMINNNRVRKFKTMLDGGTMENQFVPMALDPGQVKFKEAIADCNPYPFKVEWGADCTPSNDVTISEGGPAVVTWPSHGLVEGQPVVFTTEGTLPTGLTSGVIYFVIANGLSNSSFSVSATKGGAAIETTAAGSGTHTASAPPAGMTDMFYGLALPGARSGGEASAAHLRSWSIAVDSNIVEI